MPDVTLVVSWQRAVSESPAVVPFPSPLRALVAEKVPGLILPSTSYSPWNPLHNRVGEVSLRLVTQRERERGEKTRRESGREPGQERGRGGD